MLSQYWLFLLLILSFVLKSLDAIIHEDSNEEEEGFRDKVRDRISMVTQGMRNIITDNSPATQRQEKLLERPWTQIKKSQFSTDTVNPIRSNAGKIMKIEPRDDTLQIQFNLGDPTVSGQLPPDKGVIEALNLTLIAGKSNGYQNAEGSAAARSAVVNKFSKEEAKFTADDVVLASGTAHALEMIIGAIANKGDNILVPNPGFPLYATLCKPLGIKAKEYPINLENGTIDTEIMLNLINTKTKAIIVNNPANPTGTVFSKEVLESILKLAEKTKVPIIADEIYGDLVFNGEVFYPMARLLPKVPMIVCDGIGKRYLVPGWRLGWLIFYDLKNVLADVKEGVKLLAQKIVGPCSLVQGALPNILDIDIKFSFQRTIDLITESAKILSEGIKSIDGLDAPLKAQGTFFMIIQIDTKIFPLEKNVLSALAEQYAFYALPGTAFGAPGWFRILLTSPKETCRRAVYYLRKFCFETRHHIALNNLISSSQKKSREKSSGQCKLKTVAKSVIKRIGTKVG